MKKALFTLCLFVASALPSRALEFSPFYGSEQKRDSNIYLSDNAPKQAWINVSSVGFSLSHKDGDMSLGAHYGISQHSYSVDKGDNDYVGHDAGVSFDLRRSTDMALNFAGSYLVTTDPAVSELTQRLRRGESRLGAAYTTTVAEWVQAFVSAAALKEKYFSSDNADMDRNEYAFRGGVSYEFIDDMKVFAAYEQGLIKYSTQGDCDSSYNQPSLGLEGLVMRGISIHAEANVQRKAYSEGRSVGAYTADNTTYTPGGSFELRWQGNPDTLATLRVKRGNMESVQALSRYYVSTLAEMGFAQTIGGFIIDTGVGMEFLDSPEVTPSTGDKRKTDDLFLHAGLAYRVGKALQIGVNYLTRERTSNETGLGFTDQVFGFSVNGRF
ncbi:MAG: outer membrane beta-barrel protein [Elusimicrobia bacterium]|nr:outer membrane beta-barrel protein [Elusimicrobiota bacterium]